MWIVLDVYKLVLLGVKVKNVDSSGDFSTILRDDEMDAMPSEMISQSIQLILRGDCLESQ